MEIYSEASEAVESEKLMDNGNCYHVLLRNKFLLTLFFIIKVARLCRKKSFTTPRSKKREIKLSTNKIMRTNNLGLFGSFETCEIKFRPLKNVCCSIRAQSVVKSNKTIKS